MKKIVVIIAVIIILSINIPNTIGKTNSSTNINLLKNPNFSQENISFTLRMNINMRLARMKSISTCIIKNNSIVWSNNYGLADRLTLKKPTKDTIYMAGSITKVVTATAIMQLLENESYDFDLDDNVSEWLPFDLKNPNHPDINISFRMLLAHQSSLMGQGVTELEYLFSQNNYAYIKEVVLPNGSEYHPEYWASYKPGEKANYSNLGIILLGHIIERMTNTSYEEYCQKNIFEPLQMYNTSFTINDEDKKNLATPYYWIAGIYYRVPKTDFKFLDPAGGMYTTAEDLSHLLIAHLNNGVYKDDRILPESSIEEMHKIQYPDSGLVKNTIKLGLGWLVWVNSTNEPIIMGHGGDLLSYYARMFTRVSDNVSIIYFVNSASTAKIMTFPRIYYNLYVYAISNINRLLFEKADSL